MFLDLPLIPGILILLFVYIILTKIWIRIAAFIGETVRVFFQKVMESYIKIKGGIE